MSNLQNEYKVSHKFRQRLLELIADFYFENPDYSVYDFGVQAGVSKNIITHCVNYAIVPSARTLIKIADCLNVSLSYLLARTDENNFVKSEEPVTFQERLQEIMKEKGLKQADITNKASFPKNSISVWLKRNIYPSLENLYVLASVLDVSPDYLLDRTDDRD